MLGLDFETASSVDLKKEGLDRYINSPDFRVLCGGLSIPGCRIELDFLRDYDASLKSLKTHLTKNDVTIVFNMDFEMRVLEHLFPESPMDPRNVIDAAVVARALGAAGNLETAAQQFLGIGKDVQGERLIKKFSLPRADGTFLVDHQDDWTPVDEADWVLFMKYCSKDAALARSIGRLFNDVHHPREMHFAALTYQMNRRGWKVDMPNVDAMQDMYEDNLTQLLQSFRETYDPQSELNFRSTLQMRKWCAARGFRATSFDEQHVTKYLVQVRRKLEGMTTIRHFTVQQNQQWSNLLELEAMLHTKAQLGGSSLSKLQKIKDLTADDSILRHQYMHAGAGQTLRTSGKGVQMQNLKRLGASRINFDNEDWEQEYEWDNDSLAANIRQVFTSKHDDGLLFVVDFSSIESRILAWLAGEHWKLEAYSEGEDLYKVLARQMLDLPPGSEVSKSQRQTGKVGELSCGYGAGPGAVQRFAEKMGVSFTEDEAEHTVLAWRDSNQKIVKLWHELNEALQQFARTGATQTVQCDFATVTFTEFLEMKSSVQAVHKGARNLKIEVTANAGTRPGAHPLRAVRYFPGVYTHGKDVCYMKTRLSKSGPLWSTEWFKDGQRGRFKLYGGKLAGILTQSLAREVFFDRALALEHALQRDSPNAKIIGQFHDELVIDWHPTPGTFADDARGWEVSVTTLAAGIRHVMVKSPLPGLPIDVTVDRDYRYIK